jgi:hypothetical protein
MPAKWFPRASTPQKVNEGWTGEHDVALFSDRETATFQFTQELKWLSHQVAESGMPSRSAKK